MAATEIPETRRQIVMGSHFMASTGHHLATAAAVRILEGGGNAIDAGVAAGLCLNVVQPEYTNLGGVAPSILFHAERNELATISGVGCWPESIDPSYFDRETSGELPIGVQRCVVPAAVDAWLTALKEFGTRSLAEVAAPAIALAEQGFPMYAQLRHNLTTAASDIARYPANSAIFLAEGEPPPIGTRLIQRDLAATLRKLVEAETAHRPADREAGIQAARDRFYSGDIAREIAEFVAAEGGFLTLSDLGNYSVDIESPVQTRYRGYDVLSCGAWCQGPVVPETLAILEGYDVRSLGQNSAPALHLVIEALKAAFADRERYFGDPRLVDVPLQGLLHPDYAASWRQRIDPECAAPAMPEPGDPWQWEGRPRPANSSTPPLATPSTSRYQYDTSYLCVVDEAGNAFSATPSDGVAGPMVPGLGIVVSDRGQQSWLDPRHPSSIAPGKRPRLTPSPGLIMRDGRVFATYGTPGGDMQPQAMVQFVVNLLDFGLDAQTAIEAPRVATFSYPGSFYPHAYTPGLVRAEGRVAPAVLAVLRELGHTVEMWPNWAPEAGSICAVIVGNDGEARIGAADPRRSAVAFGW